ncbi:hypothetical protein C8F01DRAFT_1237969 [Mycena amicta]|nr:hypothetical protein C8F01DRAFT_1237969 [Mycena amicta]
MATLVPCIPPNPDISGIGVRTAIYAQNLLCFLPVIVHLSDGTISADELDGIKDQSIGMLAIAFAILISTIIQAKSSGNNPTITNYHAAIVLDLSWINNTSTWIWFLLFVHHRTQRQDLPASASWKEWYKILREPLVKLFKRESSVNRLRMRRVPRTVMPFRARVSNVALRLWDFYSKESVLTLGSLHLTVMATIGLWLWSDPKHFGTSVECDPALTIIGQGVPLSSRPLRIGSLIMYTLVLFPGLNLLPPFIFFLALHIGYNKLRRTLNSLFTSDKGQTMPHELKVPARTDLLVASLVFLVAFNVIFIFDIERTLQRNKGNQLAEDDEWGFGQVLALLLLVVPLKDAYGSFQTIWEKLQGDEKRFTELFRRDCQSQSILDELKALDAGSRVIITALDGVGDLLHLAAACGKQDLVQFLLDRGISVDAKGDYGTALCAAFAHGRNEMIEYLLGLDPQPGFGPDGPFGGPLHIAVLAGQFKTVNKFIDAGNGQEARKSECEAWIPWNR